MNNMQNLQNAKEFKFDSLKSAKRVSGQDVFYRLMSIFGFSIGSLASGKNIFPFSIEIDLHFRDSDGMVTEFHWIRDTGLTLIFAIVSREGKSLIYACRNENAKIEIYEEFTNKP